MTKCLTDMELQAVADNEADAAARSHAASCPICRARVDDTRHSLEAIGTLADRLPGPSIELGQRVRHALEARHVRQGGQESGQPTRGATTVRRQAPGAQASRWRRHAWTSGLAAAALVVLGVFVVWPSVTRESRLSAAEILGRSLQTFSVTSGVETLVYDVRFEGLATRAFVPEAPASAQEGTQAGAMRMQQVIDHDHPGRYRVMTVDTRGVLRSVLAQDPDRGVRAGRFRVDDKTYFFKFTAPVERARSFVTLPDVERAHLRALVSVMQSMSDQKLTTVDDATGSYYAIQIPPIAAESAAGQGTGNAAGHGPAMFDLSEAHALIHTGDFHLKELSARGAFLGQPFALAFTLVQHDVSGWTEQMEASMFTVTPAAGDIVLEGEATDDPTGDVVLAALRALAKMQR
jgi:hypothetical protein